MFELATDFSGAVEHLSAGHPARRQMRLIEHALRLDLHFLARPNAHRVQLDLFYDYRKNAELYPVWQERLRTTQPPTVLFWGQGDIFFTPEGGEAYLRDLPDARLVRLDSGHFAIEDSLAAIADGIRDFYRTEVTASSDAGGSAALS